MLHLLGIISTHEINKKKKLLVNTFPALISPSDYLSFNYSNPQQTMNQRAVTPSSRLQWDLWKQMLRTRLTLDLCMLPLPSLSVQIYLFLSPLKNNLIKLQCLTILDLKKIDLFSFIFTVYHCLRLEPNIIKCERNMILLHFHLKIPEDKQKQARGEYKQMNGEEQMKVRQFALLRSRQ